MMNCDGIRSLFKVTSCPRWTEIAFGKFYDLFDLCGPGPRTGEGNDGDCAVFSYLFAT